MTQVTNSLSTLAAMGLRALRENIVLAKTVNRQYESAITGARKGATVNVVVPSAVVAVDVVASNVPPTTADQTPTVVPIQLTDWKEAPFFLSDFDLERVDAGIIPAQASEAAKAISNAIELSIWSKANFAGFAGTPGTTPFATDFTAYLDARKIANKGPAPLDNRTVIFDADADAKLFALRAIQDASMRGSAAALTTGMIAPTLGAAWEMSQLVPTQQPGTGAGYLVNGAFAVGVKTIAVDTGTGGINVGAVFTIAGDPNTYAVQSTVGSPNVTSITFEPGLKVAAVDNSAITLKPAFVKNLLLHRDGIGFAMAPMIDSRVSDKLVDMQTAIDTESGLSLRVELTREHKRWRWSYDAMWGASMIRPELGVIIAG